MNRITKKSGAAYRREKQKRIILTAELKGSLQNFLRRKPDNTEGEIRDLKDKQNEQLQYPSCSSNSGPSEININYKDSMVMELSSNWGDGGKSYVCKEGDLNCEGVKGDVGCEGHLDCEGDLDSEWDVDCEADVDGTRNGDAGSNELDIHEDVSSPLPPESFENTLDDKENRWIPFLAKFSNVIEQLTESQKNYNKCISQGNIINQHAVTIETLSNLEAIKNACEDCINIGNKLLLCFEKPIIVQEINVSSHDFDLISHDPGLRPNFQTISDAQRNYLLSLGPHQPNLAIFPSDGKSRFNSIWYNEFNFLEYSTINNTAHCFICYLFANASLDALENDAWYTKGVQNWGKMKSLGKNRLGKLSQHFSSKRHKLSLQKYCNFSNRDQHVATFLNKQSTQIHLEKERILQFNRNIIHILFDTILTLSRQGLAFRGSDDDNEGNFRQIVYLLSRHNPILQKWLENAKLRPYHVTYLSPQSQNEFITIVSAELKKKIVEEINSCDFFTVMADTTPDYSHVDRLSIVIRTVDEHCKPRERLLEIMEPTGKAAIETATDILQCLNKNGINSNKLAFQSNDFASVMSGQYNGVHKKISDLVQHLVPFVPCQDHRINTAVEHCCNASFLILELFNYLEELYVFFTSSTKRHHLLCQKIKDLENYLQLRNLSKTRWTARAESIRAVHVSYEQIIDVLDDISSNNLFDKNTRLKSQGLKRKILSFDFIACLFFMKNIMYKVQILIETIETPNLNIIDVKNIVEATTEILQKLNEQSEFDNLIIAAKNTACGLGINVEQEFMKCHRRRLLPKRLDDKNFNQADFDFFLFYRKEFKSVLDTLIFRMRSTTDDVIQTLSPIFKIFQFPISPDKLKIENVEALLQMIPSNNNSPKSPNPDVHAVFAELEVLFTSCSKASSLKDVIDVLESKLNMLKLAKFVVRFVVTAGYVTATNERSFSQLKIVKNLLRTTMNNNRLNDLLLLKCEKGLLEEIHFQDLLLSWAKLKERRIEL